MDVLSRQREATVHLSARHTTLPWVLTDQVECDSVVARMAGWVLLSCLVSSKANFSGKYDLVIEVKVICDSGLLTHLGNMIRMSEFYWIKLKDISWKTCSCFSIFCCMEDEVTSGNHYLSFQRLLSAGRKLYSSNTSVAILLCSDWLKVFVKTKFQLNAEKRY